MQQKNGQEAAWQRHFAHQGLKSAVWALKTQSGYTPRSLLLIAGLQGVFNGFLGLRMVEQHPHLVHEMAGIELKPVQPEESVAYFRQKGYRIGFDHRDVWQQEHQAAFTVAKAMRLDLLKEIRGQVDQAIAGGDSFGTFQRELAPKLQAAGWWGRQDVVDPLTGETVRAQLGSARRMETIFDANLATAYSEGQWERIQRNKGMFPFLEYVRSASAHPRVSHLAYAGLVLPADDGFWQRHLPVKEWGCKCTVIQHNARSLKREGLAVGSAPAEVLRTVVNNRTGDQMQVPAGVDPAFNYPPGGRRANLGRMMMDKADAATAATAAKVMADGVETWAPLVQTEFGEFVARYMANERREIGARRVVGAFTPDVVASLQAARVAPVAATLVVDQKSLGSMLGSTASTIVSSLPTLLTQIGEAWLDQAEHFGRHITFLCSTEEPGKVAQIVVSVGTQANAVISMDIIDPLAFDRTVRKGRSRIGPHKK